MKPTMAITKLLLFSFLLMLKVSWLYAICLASCAPTLLCLTSSRYRSVRLFVLDFERSKVENGAHE